MRTIRVEISGATALLMHNPASMLLPSDGKPGKKNPTPEEEAKRAIYAFPDGALGIPTAAVRKCILTASKGYKIGKQALRPLFAGYLTIEPEDGLLPLLREGKPIKDYSIDARTVNVQRQRVIRGRARIESPWSCPFDITWDDEVLPRSLPETLRVIVERAGRAVGLLDFRPEHDGWFGRFTVAKFE